jgi:hypothetical protein
MLQNLLTKAEIPANNLAYTLSMLEIECVIVREAVWISTASLRTDPAATTTPRCRQASTSTSTWS